MTSIKTLLKNPLMLNCYLLTQTVLLMKCKRQKMFMKNFLSTYICLTLVTFQKIQSFFKRLIKKLLIK